MSSLEQPAWNSDVGTDIGYVVVRDVMMPIKRILLRNGMFQIHASGQPGREVSSDGQSDYTVMDVDGGQVCHVRLHEHRPWAVTGDEWLHVVLPVAITECTPERE